MVGGAQEYKLLVTHNRITVDHCFLEWTYSKVRKVRSAKASGGALEPPDLYPPSSYSNATPDFHINFPMQHPMIGKGAFTVQTDSGKAAMISLI
eukprot:4404011-Amphidinium_carterae.1